MQVAVIPGNFISDDICIHCKRYTRRAKLRNVLNKDLYDIFSLSLFSLVHTASCPNVFHLFIESVFF